ncbi:hypothetical protein Tco_0432309, partial [Tanacetum coccineum]
NGICLLGPDGGTGIFGGKKAAPFFGGVGQLIGMEFDVPGLVGWLPEGLSDPINCVSRSALARVLFRCGLYPDSMDLPKHQARLSIQKMCHSLGDAFIFYETPTLMMENFASFRLDQTRREHRVKPSPYPPEWNSYSFVKGGKPWNWMWTLLLHYGEVHSRHGRSTSYRSARRTRLA